MDDSIEKVVREIKQPYIDKIEALEARVEFLEKENKDYRGYFDSLEAKVKLLEKRIKGELE